MTLRICTSVSCDYRGGALLGWLDAPRILAEGMRLLIDELWPYGMTDERG